MPRAQAGGLPAPPPPLRAAPKPRSGGRACLGGTFSHPLPRLGKEQEAVRATELALAGEILGKAVPSADGSKPEFQQPAGCPKAIVVVGSPPPLLPGPQQEDCAVKGIQPRLLKATSSLCLNGSQHIEQFLKI